MRASNSRERGRERERTSEPVNGGKNEKSFCRRGDTAEGLQ
jgi:hypothetical protein